MKIAYSQCWEDSDALVDDLKITPDDRVLSIASAGDNTFALLLKNPRSITAVDYNPAQLYLCELKISAIQHLDYNDFLEFIGVNHSFNRIEIYYSIRKYLSSAAMSYWDDNLSLISKGIIHIGKLESFFEIFRTTLLPLIHSRKTIDKLFDLLTLEEQQSFYFLTWNSIRWRMLFRSFFNKFLLSLIGRNSSYFDHITQNKISEILYQRTESGFTTNLAAENWYLRFILTGTYSLSDSIPHYMRMECFHTLKNLVHKIELQHTTLDEHLSASPDRSFSKVNLSDALEYYPPEKRQRFLTVLTKKCIPGSLVSIWTLFEPINRIENFISTGNNTNHTKTFFYNSFCTWKLVGDKNGKVCI